MNLFNTIFTKKTGKIRYEMENLFVVVLKNYAYDAFCLSRVNSGKTIMNSRSVNLENSSFPIPLALVSNLFNSTDDSSTLETIEPF